MSNQNQSKSQGEQKPDTAAPKKETLQEAAFREAKHKRAAAEAVAKGSEYVIAERKSLSVLRGILGPGDAVAPIDLCDGKCPESEGKARFDEWVDRGVIVKRGS